MQWLNEEKSTMKAEYCGLVASKTHQIQTCILQTKNTLL